MVNVIQRHWNIVINLLLVSSAAVFAIGVWAPMLTLKKLVFMTNTFSVLSGVEQLYTDGQYGLFLIIALFTLVLPTAKLALLFRIANGGMHGASKRRYVRWMTAIGKWSMLDVFVVAILIASVKLGHMVTMEVHYGLYVFAASVIGLMLCTQMVQWRLRSGVN